jgi:two-component system, OmpR family, response regulator
LLKYESLRREAFLNILLAEDDRNFGLILKGELEEENHRVDLVANGVEAVLNFLSNAYDFVLLDLRMPRLGGTDALRIIKNINPQVPAIAFSGNAGSSEMEETLQCGAIKCFTKPFAITKLKECMRECFQK